MGVSATARILGFGLLLVLSAAASPSPACAAAAELRPGGRAVVVEVVDGDTVVLDRAIDGATQVRLVGIQAPKLPLGRPGFKAWPLGEPARQALIDMLQGRTVDLRFDSQPMDRHGRLLAHLYRDDGLWAQGEMLRRGLARVYSFADNRALVAEMLALEGAARAASRGIWTHPFYAVRRPEETAGRRNGFQLVEGRVLATAEVRGRVFLNFGPDWRTDFTVTLDRAAARRFRAAGVDPLAYRGKAIRVRGWLREWNGPLIEATHPEQIETLGD